MSYSWTNPEHGAWVLNLATELRQNGVDIILDKWGLKEGHDAVAFMESMVTNPKVKKVIMICDRRYAEKADGREGGVGTETQIISAKVYGETQQDKFVAVVTELNAEGKPFLPTYYANRIYIDMSSEDVYASNFEQLLRWIFDKPANIKPSIGSPPPFLDEITEHGIATKFLLGRATKLIKSLEEGAPAALDEYLTALAAGMETLRLTSKGKHDFDEEVISSIAGFLPYRNEFISVVLAAARYERDDSYVTKLHRFFERVAAYLARPEHVTSWSQWDFDNFRFIVHELFLYTVAIYLKEERFESAARLLNDEYYVPSADDGPMKSFLIFRDYLQSLEHRNARLKLGRLSVRADLLSDRANGSGVPFETLMQADFILYLRSVIDNPTDAYGHWWPETLLYAQRYKPFELFARAKSQRYFNKLLPVLAIAGRKDLDPIFSALGTGALQAPRWQHTRIHVPQLAGAEMLATTP